MINGVKFMQNLGRPESADKYALDVKSEVVNLDEGAIKSFAENAHNLV